MPVNSWFTSEARSLLNSLSFPPLALFYLKIPFNLESYGSIKYLEILMQPSASLEGGISWSTSPPSTQELVSPLLKEAVFV